MMNDLSADHSQITAEVIWEKGDEWLKNAWHVHEAMPIVARYLARAVLVELKDRIEASGKGISVKTPGVIEPNENNACVEIHLCKEKWRPLTLVFGFDRPWRFDKAFFGICNGEMKAADTQLKNINKSFDLAQSGSLGKTESRLPPWPAYAYTNAGEYLLGDWKGDKFLKLAIYKRGEIVEKLYSELLKLADKLDMKLAEIASDINNGI